MPKVFWIPIVKQLYKFHALCRSNRRKRNLQSIIMVTIGGIHKRSLEIFVHASVCPNHSRLIGKPLADIVVLRFAICKRGPLTTKRCHPFILHGYILIKRRPCIGSQVKMLHTLCTNQLVLQFPTKPHLAFLVKALHQLKCVGFKLVKKLREVPIKKLGSKR